MLIVTASDFSVAPTAGPSALVDWALSADGEMVLDHGQCAASLLPRDADVVLVLPPRAVSWHRVVLPKVPQAKLRAVLDGLLEERVLSDTNELHFALEPGGRSGQTVWVAACAKAWLQSWLQALEGVGRPVSRIVPSLWPLTPLTPNSDVNDASLSAEPTLHWAHDEGDQVWLATSCPLGVRCTPLRESANSTFGESAFGGLAPATAGPPVDIATSDPATTRWLADPSVAAMAERALNQRFDLVSRPSWLLQCAFSDWNLAQFDLSLSSGARRGQRWLRTARRWRSSPTFRAARWGLAALVAVQLVGLNVAAWAERNTIEAKKVAARQTLQQTFPHVSLVLDAPVQMQRELTQLLKVSGMLSPADLESLLGTIAQSSVEPRPIPAAIAYSNNEGRFGAWRGSEESLNALIQAMERGGWQVRIEGSDLFIRPPMP
ncbi:type II secretion system protein GspL [Hydrogenophaga sp.]|uniref:type II secretion system protein GspL n=1 Tax=Hydrogenophaga sp. TaxID=1904254 RepID=UPI002715A0E8|nr:type II secretion system protein GspL [Hydrogenophaga sp.]MDO8905468.1 type II secretion system protein GspL [Hydrogenophaga sp.]